MDLRGDDSGFVERFDSYIDDLAVHVARGSLPWTTGTSSSPNQSGPLLLRHMAGVYSAVDTPPFAPNRFGAAKLSP